MLSPEDLRVLEACYRGEGVALDPWCTDSDLDEDGDVDCNDWQILRSLLPEAPLLEGPCSDMQEVSFRRADVDANGSVELTDPVAALNCFFLGGVCSSCDNAVDANDDGELDIADPIFILSWLFLGGATPPEPGPTSCGPDPTVDLLDCERFGCVQ